MQVNDGAAAGRLGEGSKCGWDAVMFFLGCAAAMSLVKKDWMKMYTIMLYIHRVCYRHDAAFHMTAYKDTPIYSININSAHMVLQ